MNLLIHWNAPLIRLQKAGTRLKQRKVAILEGLKRLVYFSSHLFSYFSKMPGPYCVSLTGNHTVPQPTSPTRLTKFCPE